MNTTIATLADTFRDARSKFESGSSGSASGQGSEFGKWIIIAAAVFGALMLMRCMRRFTGLLWGFFWLWFWTRGAWHHVF